MSAVADAADAAGVTLQGRLLDFARVARDNGFAIGMKEKLDALVLAGGGLLLDQRRLRWGLKSLFCSTARDWQRFDEIFDAYWLGRGMKTGLGTGGSASRGEATGRADSSESSAGEDADGEEAGDGELRGASSAESLAQKDFRYITDPEELRRIYALTERLAARLRWRLSRRRRVRASGRTLDLRNTIHRSLRFGGVPLRLAFRRRRPQPLKLVVLLDASGSMELYSVFFLHFMRGVIENFRHSDAFAFHTRLLPLKGALTVRRAVNTFDQLSVLSTGWGGGTRIGASLKTFNDGYAAQALNSRAVVMIVSDGYDTGAPEELAGEMKRLAKRTRRIVWINPLIAWRGYEPTAQGMQAALPHVDLFAPGHNLESLMALEPYLEKL